MVDKSLEDAMEKVEGRPMEGLAKFMEKNTGVFGDRANDSVVFHIGGLSCEYYPRSNEIKIGEDPVYTFVEGDDEFYVSRVKASSSHPGDVEKPHPRLIIRRSENKED